MMRDSSAPLLLSRIKAPSLKDLFMKDLLSQILSGALQPGDRLPAERDLAVQAGISRSLVNQAILELEAQGFVQMIPRKGTFVADYQNNPTPQSLVSVMTYGSSKLDPKLFEDMMNFRILVETDAVRRICEDEKSTFANHVHEMLDLLADVQSRTESPARSLARFHYLLVKAGGNSISLMTYRAFEPVILTLIERHYELKDNRNAAVEVHYQLLDALRKKDRTKAEESIHQCIEMGKAILEEQYSD